MKLSNMMYFFREASKSLSRNRLLSFATITTVAVCILILGMAVLLTLNASRFINRLESDVQMIAFLDKTLTKAEINEVRAEIEKIEGIKSIKFISRDQSLAELQETYGSEYDLKATLGKNPLPHTFEIEAQNPQEVPKIAKQVDKIVGVYKVNYGQGIVERLFQVTHWVRIISVAFIIVLAAGAVFLIATTTRLSVFARRKEIYLMKLIGATDWFIRWPFFIEGIFLGVAGSLLAVGLLALGYGALLQNITSMAIINLVSDMTLLGKVYLSLVAAGAVLGVLGTYISLNRFLDV
ncbi:MAG TPA: permease-like cell division protein FtsX [Syntrophomonadaceae bacterium]|nr:permease-like cell division protein FtsX [Syntrophomonadaceae bacterium]HQA08041.1 permease-like cell division protein FtsX [Syntrophomonadaceae bacterium]HQE23837.1 permease-like cell division protein FtsX [Syntrophomonadaceae bacterium]